jgi:hypothetical protein
VQTLPNGLDPAEYWIILLLVCVATIGAFYYAFRNWRRARIIEDAPTAKIHSAHQGYVELEGDGRLMDGDPIIAPLTNNPCLWFRYKIERKEQHRTSEGTTTSWSTVREAASDNLFYLRDETGRCVIDPDGAEVTTDDKLVWYGDTSWPQDAPLLGSGAKFFSDGRFRYTEWLVLQNQPLYVIGEFKTMSPATSYSVTEITRDLIRTWKQDQTQMLERFDIDKDGHIDQEEWELVRKSAKMHAQKEYQEQAKEPDIHIIAKPEDSHHPFLLSVYPQEHLTRRYRIRAGWSLAGFFLVGSAAAWLLQFRL